MRRFNASFELRLNETFEGMAELYVQPVGRGVEILFSDEDLGELTLSLGDLEAEELLRQLSNYLFPE